MKQLNQVPTNGSLKLRHNGVEIPVDVVDLAFRYEGESLIAVFRGSQDETTLASPAFLEIDLLFLLGLLREAQVSIVDPRMSEVLAREPREGREEKSAGPLTDPGHQYGDLEV